MVFIGCWNSIKLVGPIFEEITTLCLGTNLTPTSGAEMFTLIGHGPSMDEILNTEWEYNPSKRSGTGEAHIHPYMQTGGIPHSTFCNREGGGGLLKMRKYVRFLISIYIHDHNTFPYICLLPYMFCTFYFICLFHDTVNSSDNTHWMVKRHCPEKECDYRRGLDLRPDLLTTLTHDS
jgi:hypothetical protein